MACVPLLSVAMNIITNTFTKSFRELQFSVWLWVLEIGESLAPVRCFFILTSFLIIHLFCAVFYSD